MRFVLLLAAPAARAEACPGRARAACPYASATIVGQRAESVLRFPEAVALGPEGDVYVADQLSYVVQKFGPTGAFISEWGSYGSGHGQFGPIGGLAVDAAGNVYVVDSSHDRIEKFNRRGIPDLVGACGRGLGEFRFVSTQNPAKPPGGAIAVTGEYVYVADSGNNRIERFDLDGGEAMEWGSKGSGPGQFSYPHGVAANGDEVVVADDDNHRIEKFGPEGTFESQDGEAGSGPEQFSFPYGVALDGAGNVYVADDMNSRVVELNPELDYVRAWGGYGLDSRPADVPARNRRRTGGRQLCRRHGERSSRGVLRERPVRTHDRHPRAVTGRADRTARGRGRSEWRPVRLRHGRQSRRAVRGRRPSSSVLVVGGRRATADFAEPTGIAFDPRGAATSPTRVTGASRACGEKAPIFLKSGVRASSAARCSAAPARWRCPRSRASCTWPTPNTTAC